MSLQATFSIIFLFFLVHLLVLLVIYLGLAVLLILLENTKMVKKCPTLCRELLRRR